MKNELEQLKQELEQLEKAYKNKLLSTNEYCDIYHAISKKIKSLSIN